METRENAEFCPALAQGLLAPVPQCWAARFGAQEAPRASSRLKSPERQEREVKLSCPSWSSPRETSFCYPSNAGAATGASDFHFTLHIARGERDLLVQEASFRQLCLGWPRLITRNIYELFKQLNIEFAKEWITGCWLLLLYNHILIVLWMAGS